MVMFQATRKTGEQSLSATTADSCSLDCMLMILVLPVNKVESCLKVGGPALIIREMERPGRQYRAQRVSLDLYLTADEQKRKKNRESSRLEKGGKRMEKPLPLPQNPFSCDSVSRNVAFLAVARHTVGPKTYRRCHYLLQTSGTEQSTKSLTLINVFLMFFWQIYLMLAPF